MKILLGTGNPGKVKELKSILDSYKLNNVEILCLKDMDKQVEEPIEDGETFFANAYIKAKYYFEQYQIPTICEDTGLLVKALNNAPGVHTARYGSVNGEHTSPELNMKRLLKELDGIKERDCMFKTAMIYYDGNVMVTSCGEMHGSIAYEKKGEGGFGYDPIFYLPKYQKTLSEVGDDIKNTISHRFVATNHLIKQLLNYHIFK